MKITIEQNGRPARVLSLGDEEVAALTDAIDCEAAPVAELVFSMLKSDYIYKFAKSVWKETLYTRFGTDRVLRVVKGERPEQCVREYFDSFADNGGEFTDEDRVRCEASRSE